MKRAAFILAIPLMAGTAFAQTQDDRISVKGLNNIRFADQFPGANAGARITAAITALPTTGGTVDARGLEDVQTISADPFTGITKPVTLIIGGATIAVNVDVTVSSNITLTLQRGAILAVATGKTLTINGDLTGSTLSTHFSGAGTVAINSVDSVFPEYWGATGGADDTAAVQATLDSAASVKFSRHYNVTTLTASGVHQRIDFNNFVLTGVATGATGAIFEITGRQLTLLNMGVDQDYNTNYTSAVWWHSVSARVPAEWNTIFGLRIFNATKGVIFGADIGGTSVAVPQSENTIYSYVPRGVQVPFIGNQTNGFITLVAPILDCSPYEWTTQPGYNETTFNTNAYAFRNQGEGTGQNNLTIIGGEILKPGSTLGYGMWGGSFKILGAALEIASTQAYLTSSAVIKDNFSGFMSGDVDGFEVDPSATGSLQLYNYSLSKSAGRSASSIAKLMVVRGEGMAAYTLEAYNSTFIEWRWNTDNPTVQGVSLFFRDVSWYSTPFTGTVNYPGQNVFTTADNTGLQLSDTLSTLSQAGWAYTHDSGGGSSGWQRNTSGLPSDYPASIQLVETGQSHIQSPIGLLGFPVAPSSTYLVSGMAKVNTLAGGTNQMQCKVEFYGKTGAALSTETITAIGTTTSFSEFALPVYSPSAAAFASVHIYVVNLYTYNITGLAVTPVRVSRSVARPSAVTSFRAARISSQGTPLVVGDFSLSAGWGNTAAVSAVTGTDQGWNITVTCGGTGIGTNPTVTLTFKDGTWTNAPIGISKMVGGTGTVTDLTDAPTATTWVITFNGTPVDTKTYFISGIAMGR